MTSIFSEGVARITAASLLFSMAIFRVACVSQGCYFLSSTEKHKRYMVLEYLLAGVAFLTKRLLL